MKGKKKASSQHSNLFDELELPEGWTLTKIRDIVTINYGKGLKDADRAGGSVSVYGSNGIVGSHNKALTDGPSIIIGRKGSIGEVHYSANPSWPIDTTYYIDTFEGIDQTFLVFALKSLNLSNLDTSTAIPGLNRDDIYDQEIPLPSLNEQQRIVARVEALLTHINAAREPLSRVPLIMKKFRQAVLAAACSGRLTEGWRKEHPKIESAIFWMEKTGIKSINLQPDLMIPEYLPNLPESWDYSSVNEIAQFIGSGITPKGGRDVYVPEGIPFIRSQNVYPDGLRLDDIVFVTEKMHKEMKRTHVSPNDVLLNITGASIGRCTCVPEKFFEANVNQHVCIIRVVSDFLPIYLSIFLNSPHGQKQIFDNQGGVTRQGLNYSQLRAIILPLPPLAEQYEIVRRVGLLFERADAFDQVVVSAGLRCERLTQAVLGKAFRGELVGVKE